MNFKYLASLVAVGTTLLAFPGCSADAIDNADAEEAGASDSDLTTNAARLAHAYHYVGSFSAPSFDGLVLDASGTFFADVDSGIRCQLGGPCPSEIRVTGSFTATKNYLRLKPLPGAEASPYHGRYGYTLVGDHLVLTRADGTFKAGWNNQLDVAPSYCAAPTDCAGQPLPQVKCIGDWTCSTMTSACAFECGGPKGSDIWPADATKLVASSSAGFGPPPPPGSTCAIGKRSFALDVATKELTWETCKHVDLVTPFTTVTGTKQLTAAEYATVDRAMRELKLSTLDICGADKPFMTIGVTTMTTMKTYRDSFYSCNGDGPYVDNIGGVFAAMSDAAGL